MSQQYWLVGNKIAPNNIFSALAFMVAATLCSVPTVKAQTPMGAAYGVIWTPAQWNNWSATKADVTNGTLNNPTINTPTINNPIINGGTLVLNKAILNSNAAPLPALLTGSLLQIGNADTTVTRAELDSFGAASFWSCRRADGINALPTAIQSGDEICSLNTWGYDGVAWQGPQAAVRTFAAEIWSSGHRGTRVAIATTAIAGTTMTDRIGFENDGGITVPPTVTSGSLGSGTLNAGAGYGIGGSLVISTSEVAATLVGNPTAGAAVSRGFTIQGLTDIATPSTTLDLIPIWNHTTGTIENVNASELAAGEAVSSVFTRTGAVTATGGDYSAFMRSYIAGVTLSNDGTTPNSVLDISAGVANDTTNAVTIVIGAFTKSTAGAWASGTAANGMGNGLTIASSTWYHVCLANNGGVPDIWFDTSATCANKPTGITDTKFRRIGSFKTDSSAHILAFSQNGNEFLWGTSTLDVNTTTLGTVSTLETLNTPLGVKVNALTNTSTANASVGVQTLITSPDQGTPAASAPTGNETLLIQVATIPISSPLNVRTNTSSQVRAVASISSTTLIMVTYGWIDTRGALN